MKIDFVHNKIVRETVTDAFCESFESRLMPKLCEKYSDSLLGVQMYEDYLSDGFLIEGRFYYPLTLVLSDGPFREWISWSVANKKHFVGKIPYSYIADEPLEFVIEDSVPEELSEKLKDRGIYFEGGCAPFDLEYDSPDKTFLSGKYSQRFMDELNRQISDKIEKAFSVSGIENGGVCLKMVFAPGTYMEHVLGEYTYRRLLISARACSARDLWIRWKRKGSTAPITISDNIPEEELLFEICEDVPQKIREKEHRFLVSSSADKYQTAMGRKRITEWRDLVKRVIKRGELKAVESVDRAEWDDIITEPVVEAPIFELAASASVPAKESELIARLQETLAAPSALAVEPEESKPQDDDNGDIAAMLKNLLGVDGGEESNEDESEEDSIFDMAESLTVTGDVFDSFAEPAAPVADAEMSSEDNFTLDGDTSDEISSPQSLIDEDELRRKIEEEVRERLLAEARLKTEAEELRRAHDALKAENERLAALARKAEEERAVKEAERIAENERLRREIEARERAEAIEKERMAEAARLALLENQRLEAEREAEESRRAKEALEAAKAAEEARIAEQRRLEAQRIEAEMRAREAAAAAAAAAAEVKEPVRSQSYISKNAKLLFRRPIDPNITKRIHEIILTTIKYFKKENVYIKIKATVPDSTTVNLHFVKIPEEEHELLVNIIKVLGKSELGIIKAILE